ncbi:heme o synthase [Cupriavidus sp. YR651]|uniref:heme o synthase n=1 Tax=Cupriavidus sp. YR651 TaxID=1855315 RepID=UPI000B830E33|nr:heme o synthase [Cupriavidus sp. YR651]
MYRPLLQLTKPGIVIGNLISVTGGFLLASRGNIDWGQGCLVAVSVALTIASGCVVNNVVDRDIDGLMERTRNRPIVTGEISILSALIYGGVLGLTGIGLLYFATQQLLPVYMLLLGYVVYAGIYTLYLKRNSIYGTLVGSISGAMPPVVGYCSASGTFDTAAITLLLMFSLWQMPHSYAIAIFREKDYRAAAIPVLPVVKGFTTARWHIALYILAFTSVTMVLGLLGYAGKVYMLVALLSGIYWFHLGLAGWATDSEPQWARKIFFASILVITLLSIAMSLDSHPPVPGPVFHRQ